MEESYALLLQDQMPRAREPQRAYRCLTERHLQAMWLEQKYLRRLMTESKESLEVISPGSWNVEAGPDFLNAHIRIGGRELRGDIELHLHSAGWTQHGHHQDPRYNRVILHVVLWPPLRATQSYTLRGAQLPTVLPGTSPDGTRSAPGPVD